MNRRNFTQLAGLSGLGMLSNKAFAIEKSTNKHTFNLDYAPHLGMFRNMAGEDPIDQLNFMADQGFTAFEDNGMKDRSVDLQKKMAATMEKRNMQMGVFVAHKIYWREPNLAGGKEDLREEFLQHIRESVEVA